MFGLKLNSSCPAVVLEWMETSRVQTFHWPRMVSLQSEVLERQHCDHARYSTTSAFAVRKVYSVLDNCGKHKTEKASAPFEAISTVGFPTSIQTTSGGLL